MNQPGSVAAVYEQIDRARRAGPLVTNLYPSQDKLQRWIERGELFVRTVGNVLFVLRRDRDFLHVSYVASAPEEVAAALEALVETIRETMTIDVIGKPEQVDEAAKLFRSAGFRSHCAMHRMMKLGEKSLPLAPDPDVVFAGRDDGAALAGMLEAALDRFTEQIPDVDEMTSAAADHKILIIRSGEAIAGLLFYEVTGQSSLLRHWVVDPAHRDQRVGARLIRRYFANCPEVRRFVLWVISDNHNAIDRYRHYGYHEDGLIDQVLIRQAS